MAISVHYTQEDRDEFYRRAREHGNEMNSLGEMRGEMRVQSYDNAYARFKYAQMQRDDIKLEEGRRLETEAQADCAGAVAQAGNFIGDVFCGGAQRNLDNAYEAAVAGQWKQAAGELGRAGGKVVVEGLKDASLGLVAKGLNVAARTGKLGQKLSTTLQTGSELVRAAGECRAVKAGESLDKAAEVREAYTANRSLPPSAQRNLERNAVGHQPVVGRLNLRG